MAYPGNASLTAAVSGLCLIVGSAAAAQDGPLGNLGDLTSASAIEKAASQLEQQIKNSVLIKDLLGKSLKGADGATLGTVVNFAVAPGGRLVAALVETGDGTRLAVPFAAVKVVGKAKDAGLETVRGVGFEEHERPGVAGGFVDRLTG